MLQAQSKQPWSIFLLHPSDYLTDHEPHGDGLVAFGFIKELARRGHRLHVAARNISLCSKLPENVTLHLLPRRIRVGLLDRLEYMVRARMLFQRLQRTESIQLIHQMNPVFAGLSLAMAGAGVPLVLGTIVPRWPKDPDAIAERHPFAGKFLTAAKDFIVALQQKHATLLLLTSHAAENRLPNPDEVREKVMFVPHGIDTQLFSPATVKRVNAPPVILYLANLQKRKGIYTLIESFSEVVKTIPRCRLRIVGTGPEAASVSRYVNTFACRGQIDFIGSVPREKVVDHLRDCSVYCLPSYGEPYGMTVAEAMSCGVPVVATDAGGIPHMVPEGGGRLVRPGDAKQLASTLIEVLSDESLQRSMGEVNRQHAVNSLSWGHAGDRLELGYRTAFSRYNAPQSSHVRAITDHSAGEVPQ